MSNFNDPLSAEMNDVLTTGEREGIVFSDITVPDLDFRSLTFKDKL